jgi:hypothetical protein
MDDLESLHARLARALCARAAQPERLAVIAAMDAAFKAWARDRSPWDAA